MLPALRSRANLTRVINQLLAARRQQDAFRVPAQNSSAVSVVTNEQRALNLKIWPGKLLLRVQTRQRAEVVVHRPREVGDWKTKV